MLGLYYIFLSVVVVFLILYGHYKAAVSFYKTKEIASQKTKKVALFFVGIFLYIGCLSYFDVLLDFGMPPRFPLFLVLPLIIFLIYFIRRNKSSAFIKSIPLQWTAFYQSFRIFVELLLHATFLKAIVPIEATYLGHNFDVVIGITAIFIGFLILRTGKTYINLLKAWNVLGIIMILIVAATIASSIYNPSFWGYESVPVDPSFLRLPLVLIPSFLAPSAIFMHVVSLIQLGNKKSV